MCNDAVPKGPCNACANEILKCCMEEILGRLRSYGTLQPDSLEAMRNEYVVALLHASIHIVMDITNKELSMRPQYGIVGEVSPGRIDYAIKVIFCYSNHVSLSLTRTI